jgi:uncharacterized protein
MVPRLVLFTRYPEPGRCKTRLIPAVGAQGAAKVHAALTEATLACLGPSAEIHIEGETAAVFADWLGAERPYVPQAQGDLGDRLLGALDPAPVILFGSDTPDLKAEIVASAQAALLTHDVVIGPAEDGGYYLIGMNAPHRSLFQDMPWSTDQLCADTLSKCAALGLSVAQLAPLSDCDTPEDLKRWPWLGSLSVPTETNRFPEPIEGTSFPPSATLEHRKGNPSTSSGSRPQFGPRVSGKLPRP